MAISANTNWEIRSTGTTTGGGGFVTGSGGTDYSQQNSPQLSVTDAACTGTTTITSATGGFTSAMIGNLIYLSSGPGWYQITGHTDTNTITIDRNGPNASGMTANVGGALSSLKTAIDNGVSGNYFWIPGSDTVTVSSAINFDHTTQYTGFGYFYVCGYTTTHGDTVTEANRPVIQATAAISIFSGDNYCGPYFRNLVFDGNSTGTYAITYGAWAYSFLTAECCEFKRFTSHGIYNVSAVFLFRCSLHDNGGSGIGDYGGNCYAWACHAYNNAGHGFGKQGGRYVNCVASNNGGHGFFIYGNGANLELYNCTAGGNTGYGIVADGGTCTVSTYNCISSNNGGYGIQNAIAIYNCAYGNNTSGNVNGLYGASIGNITLSADPFVNLAGNNLALNNTAGGGASCRAAGFPGAFPGGLTTGYLDVGAVQHQDSPSTTISIPTSQPNIVGGRYGTVGY